jgi:rsbT co-antagonist protein RsbR
MGAQAVITGLSADVAQALVALGIDVGRLSTVGDLQGGLEEAERMLGFQSVPIEGA